MARRMFSDDITSSDAFLEMPDSAQNLYFHLGMTADDDGFIGSPKMVMRVVRAGEDDYKILVAKKFILHFEKGICVVKHWRINNQIRKDRYTPTKYLPEKSTLFIKENGAYTQNANKGLPVPKGHFTPTEIEDVESGNQLATKGQPSIGKVSKVKVSKTATEVELPDWLDKCKWQEWIAYRKERRLTCTATTLARQIKLLGENQSNHGAIIEKSITNGWQGLFPISGGTKKSNALVDEHTQNIISNKQRNTVDLS